MTRRTVMLVQHTLSSAVYCNLGREPPLTHSSQLINTDHTSRRRAH